MGEFAALDAERRVRPFPTLLIDSANSSVPAGNS